MVESLEGLASVMLAMELLDRATRLWGSAEALREKIDFPIPPNEQKQYTHYVEKARAALGNGSFTSSWAEGRLMTIEQAAAYALEDSMRGVDAH